MLIEQEKWRKDLDVDEIDKCVIEFNLLSLLTFNTTVQGIRIPGEGGCGQNLSSILS